MSDVDYNVELGYTPENLKKLRKKHGLNQTDVAKVTGIKNYRQVSRWETDISKPLHATMPHIKWILLLKHLGYL